MKPAIETSLIALSCVAGGALLAFAIGSLIASVGGAALLPMGINAFATSGGLLGLVLAASSASLPTTSPGA